MQKEAVIGGGVRGSAWRLLSGTEAGGDASREGRGESVFPGPSRRVQLQQTDTITGPVQLDSELERLCSDHTNR